MRYIEVSRALNISKGKVIYLAQKLSDNAKYTDKNGIRHLTAAGFEQLKELITTDCNNRLQPIAQPIAENHATSKEEARKDSSTTDCNNRLQPPEKPIATDSTIDLIQVLQSEVKTLTEQLKTKDEQIKSLSEMLSQVTEVAARAQALHAGTIKTLPTEPAADNREETAAQKPPTVTTSKPKTGRLSGLLFGFKRKKHNI